MTIEIPSELRPENPLRAVDWRTGLIAFLKQHDPERLYPWQDPWRKRAWQLDQLPDRHPPTEEMYLQYPFVLDSVSRLIPRVPKWPFLADYLRNPTRGDDLKNLLESYILAGLSAADIAKRIPDITVPVVEAYQAMHFDVGDRLHDRDFILKHVLQLDSTVGIANDEPYVMWLECGYLAGAECLDVLTSFCRTDVFWNKTYLKAYLNDRHGASELQKSVARDRFLADHDRTWEVIEQLYSRLTLQLDLNLPDSTLPSAAA